MISVKDRKAATLKFNQIYVKKNVKKDFYTNIIKFIFS